MENTSLEEWSVNGKLELKTVNTGKNKNKN